MKSALKSSKLTLASLIFANTIPIFGVVVWNWDVFTILFLFWAETGVIGLYAILRSFWIYRWVAVLFLPFYLVHFVMFMAVHLAFILSIFTEYTANSFFPSRATMMLLLGGVSASLIGFFVSHGISFVKNFIGDEEFKLTYFDLMTGVYSRIAIIHVVLVITAFLLIGTDQSVISLVLLIICKICLDIYFHLRERRKNGKITEKKIRNYIALSMLTTYGPGILFSSREKIDRLRTEMLALGDVKERLAFLNAELQKSMEFSSEHTWIK